MIQVRHLLFLLLLVMGIGCQQNLPIPAYPYVGKHTLKNYSITYNNLNLLDYIELPEDYVGSYLIMGTDLMSYPTQNNYYWIFGLTEAIGEDHFVIPYFTEDDYGRVSSNFIGFGESFGGSAVEYQATDQGVEWYASQLLHGYYIAITFSEWGIMAGKKAAMQASQSQSLSDIDFIAERFTYYRDYQATNDILVTRCNSIDCELQDLVYFFASGYVQAFTENFSQPDPSWLNDWNTSIGVLNDQGQSDALLIFNTYENNWKGQTLHRWEFELQ